MTQESSGVSECAGLSGSSAKRTSRERLFDGLKRLEYRGYDSAPASARSTTASSSAAGPRASSTISRASLPKTRCRHHRHRPYALGDAWRADRRQCPSAHRRAVALVHNGIIENFKPLRDELIAEGRELRQRDRHRSRRPSRRARARAGRVAAGCGRRGAAAPARRLRHRLPVPRPSGSDHRRAARGAADRRLWRGRELSRLGRDRAGAADPAHRLSGRGRLGGGAPRAHRDFRPRQPAGRARDRQIRRVVGAGREGQSPPLHAEGDFRAADRRCPDAPDLCPPVRGRGRAAGRGCRPGSGRAADDRRLRHQLSMPGWSRKYWIEQFARVPVDIDVA